MFSFGICVWDREDVAVISEIIFFTARKFDALSPQSRPNTKPPIHPQALFFLVQDSTARRRTILP